MNISNIGQTISSASVLIGKNIPSQTVNQITTSNGSTELPSRKIDMRNVSLNEINELIKLGVDGLLDVIPYNNITEFLNLGVTPDGFYHQNSDPDGSYREYIMNKKIDFIGNIENAIKFEKSIGKSVGFLEKVLANLNQINGIELLSRIDISA